MGGTGNPSVAMGIESTSPTCCVKREDTVLICENHRLAMKDRCDAFIWALGDRRSRAGVHENFLGPVGPRISKALMLFERQMAYLAAQLPDYLANKSAGSLPTDSQVLTEQEQAQEDLERLIIRWELRSLRRRSPQPARKTEETSTAEPELASISDIEPTATVVPPKKIEASEWQFPTLQEAFPDLVFDLEDEVWAEESVKHLLETDIDLEDRHYPNDFHTLAGRTRRSHLSGPCDSARADRNSKPQFSMVEDVPLTPLPIELFADMDNEKNQQILDLYSNREPEYSTFEQMPRDDNIPAHLQKQRIHVPVPPSGNLRILCPSKRARRDAQGSEGPGTDPVGALDAYARRVELVKEKIRERAAKHELARSGAYAGKICAIEHSRVFEEDEADMDAVMRGVDQWEMCCRCGEWVEQY
ncbi:MAG: hypothetical protein M1828_002435 [Chrysothrix sp. TS-e1954]|nr:MAG: hypothetical protein M1828_002435 [Chrysothrix sp. TS-e1954]